MLFEEERTKVMQNDETGGEKRTHEEPMLSPVRGGEGCLVVKEGRYGPLWHPNSLLGPARKHQPPHRLGPSKQEESGT